MDKSIRQLMLYELAESNLGIVEISFDQPTREWRGSASKIINFFLYDIRENAALRQHRWEEAGENGHGVQSNGSYPQIRMQRSPLRIDCFYLVTAWSENPNDEHLLLAECLLALARYPILNQHDLNAQKTQRLVAEGKLRAGETVDLMGGRKRVEEGERPLSPDFLVTPLQGLRYEIRTRLANHDVMTNPAEIWGTLENAMRAGFSYVVTLPMDPWAGQQQSATEVGSVIFKTEATQLADDEDELIRMRSTNLPSKGPNLIGGVVQMAKIPRHGVNVRIVERGMSVQSDAEGRFIFRRVPPGTYTLEVRIDKDGSPIAEKKEVVVPRDTNQSGNVIYIPVENRDQQ
ncbi:MAG: Pvc16 family protein [Caldilineaceae bacterium]